MSSEPGSGDPEDAAGALCRHAAWLVSTVPRQVHRLHLRAGDASVELEWPVARTGRGQPPADAEPAEQAVAPGDDHVCAPLVGTFYRSPREGAPPFVDVGDEVEPGQQLAIIEAMKLMNPVTAERAGRITEVLVADATSVEYAQPLFAITPCDEQQ